MKIPSEVVSAKELMNDAMRWSVMTWLREKKRVRKTADLANAALDRVSDELRQRWPENIRSAYQALNSGTLAKNGNGHRHDAAKDTEVSAIAQRLRNADDEAYQARALAEQMFDEAEKKLSTSLARQGCEKAIRAWELHELAILQAEKCAV